MNMGSPSMLDFDNYVTAPAFGYKDRKDYYFKTASVHSIPLIEVPTFFLNSLDDPVVGLKAIDYKIFNDNENVALGVTKHGGHMGCYESISDMKNNWAVDIALNFFSVFVS